MLWRFYTAPGPGHVGHSSWAGHSWFTGGATVWSSIEVDRRLGLLYIHTGNASPDFNGSQRAGNNLFSVSLVALDLRTGRYRWHFQEVHHDIWDYDSAQPAQLFTLVREPADPRDCTREQGRILLHPRPPQRQACVSGHRSAGINRTRMAAPVPNPAGIVHRIDTAEGNRPAPGGSNRAALHSATPTTGVDSAGSGASEARVDCRRL